VAPGDLLYAGSLLSSVRLRQGRFEEAEKIAKQGTEVRIADAEAKGGAWGMLSDVYRDWDRLPDAVAASREAVRVTGEGKGLAMAGVLNNLAWMLAWNGEGAEAEKTARRAVQLTEEANGSLSQLSGHLDTLAFALLVNGKPTEAEAIARKAIERGEKGKLSLVTQAYEHATLARILAAQKRVADAEVEFQTGMRLGEKKPGREFARLLESYAALLRENGRAAEAEPLTLRAQAIRKPAEPPPSPEKADGPAP